MSNKTKLELTWIGKYEKKKIEPRILVEDKEKSYGDENSENLLIHGDNLLALKSLEQKYAGKIKCIYIDPPYNTGSAFEHYNDNVEHSIWLSLMKERIQILRKLLTEDGTIWISIDDDERDYLKIMCDEIFGRHNFVTSCIWHKKHTRSNDARWFSDNHDYILVFAKNKENWNRNLLPRSNDSSKGYSNPDNDPRGVWASGPCHAKTPNVKDIYPIITPSGREISPPPGTSWRFAKDKFNDLIQDNRIWFGENGNNIPRFKRFLTDVQDGFVPTTLWFREEVGDNQEAKKEIKEFNHSNVFATPKPERLIERVLHIATSENDLVLDSFLGSGTTCAVAHKMNRKWIGIEMGDHIYTHCIPRLNAVIDGEDKGGITKSVNWQGGGGYKFYELAPSLLNKDSFGNWVISDEYDADMLAEAMTKHNGFTYYDEQEVFFKQGYSTEKDFIFTTTNFLTVEYLNMIHECLNTDESLLICCKAFQEECENKYSNITIKKIPQSILKKYEFGDVDYNLVVSVDESDMGEEDYES